MKYKIPLMILGLLLGVSCEKEVTEPVKQENETITQPEVIQKVSNYRVLYKLHDSGHADDDFWICAGSGGNCLPTVEVTGASNTVVLTDIYQAIDDNDATAVSGLFSAHQNQLVGLFPQNVVSGVIGGSLTLEKGAGASGDLATYLMFKNLQGELVLVKPIIIN